jgi:hypothetical protein
LKRVRSGAERDSIIERARNLRGEPHHCDSGYMCYYHVEGASGPG